MQAILVKKWLKSTMAVAGRHGLVRPKNVFTISSRRDSGFVGRP
ncbi:hypothetical protein [Comamonas odontotermitis]